MSAELNRSYQDVALDLMEKCNSQIVDQMLKTLEGDALQSVRLGVLTYFRQNPSPQKELAYYLPWLDDKPEDMVLLAKIVDCYTCLNQNEDAATYRNRLYPLQARYLYECAKRELEEARAPSYSLNSAKAKEYHFREASTLFAQAILCDVNNSYYRREYVKALSENGYQEQAIKEAKLAIDVEDSFENNLTLLNVYAYALQMDEYKKIEREIERKFPDELSVRCWVAERNIKDGKYDTGIPMASAIFSDVSAIISTKPEIKHLFEFRALRSTVGELLSTDDTPYSWHM